MSPLLLDVFIRLALESFFVVALFVCQLLRYFAVKYYKIAISQLYMYIKNIFFTFRLELAYKFTPHFGPLVRRPYLESQLPKLFRISIILQVQNLRNFFSHSSAYRLSARWGSAKITRAKSPKPVFRMELKFGEFYKHSEILIENLNVLYCKPLQFRAF